MSKLPASVVAANVDASHFVASDTFKAGIHNLAKAGFNEAQGFDRAKSAMETVWKTAQADVFVSVAPGKAINDFEPSIALKLKEAIKDIDDAYKAGRLARDLYSKAWNDDALAKAYALLARSANGDAKKTADEKAALNRVNVAAHAVRAAVGIRIKAAGQGRKPSGASHETDKTQSAPTQTVAGTATNAVIVAPPVATTPLQVWVHDILSAVDRNTKAHAKDIHLDDRDDFRLVAEALARIEARAKARDAANKQPNVSTNTPKSDANKSPRKRVNVETQKKAA